MSESKMAEAPNMRARPLPPVPLRQPPSLPFQTAITEKRDPSFSQDDAVIKRPPAPPSKAKERPVSMFISNSSDTNKHTKRRPEITIVAARPMSEVGFRDAVPTTSSNSKMAEQSNVLKTPTKNPVKPERIGRPAPSAPPSSILTLDTTTESQSNVHKPVIKRPPPPVPQSPAKPHTTSHKDARSVESKQTDKTDKPPPPMPSPRSSGKPSTEFKPTPSPRPVPRKRVAEPRSCCDSQPPIPVSRVQMHIDGNVEQPFSSSQTSKCVNTFSLDKLHVTEPKNDTINGESDKKHDAEDSVKMTALPKPLRPTIIRPAKKSPDKQAVKEESICTNNDKKQDIKIDNNQVEVESATIKEKENESSAIEEQTSSVLTNRLNFFEQKQNSDPPTVKNKPLVLPKPKPKPATKPLHLKKDSENATKLPVTDALNSPETSLQQENCTFVLKNEEVDKPDTAMKNDPIVAPVPSFGKPRRPTIIRPPTKPKRHVDMEKTEGSKPVLDEGHYTTEKIQNASKDLSPNAEENKSATEIKDDLSLPRHPRSEKFPKPPRHAVSMFLSSKDMQDNKNSCNNHELSSFARGTEATSLLVDKTKVQEPGHKVPPMRPRPPKQLMSSANETSTEPHQHSEKPKPVRPPIASAKLKEKDVSPSKPPNLPPRPGPQHPLYSYMENTPHAIAQYDFEGSGVEDLSFQEGEMILLIDRINDSWMKGKINEREGIFPLAYVRTAVPLEQEQFTKNEPKGALESAINAWDHVEGVDTGEIIIESEDSIGHGPRCRARFDFDGEGTEDLQFEEGDCIQLMEKVGEEWAKGEINGKVGIFPLVFVEIIEDLPSTAEENSQEQIASAPESIDPDEKEAQSCSICTALCNFSASQDGELSFTKGDVIQIISHKDDDWIYGRLNEKEGIFPASFVETKIDSSTLNNKNPTTVFGLALYDFDGESTNELTFKVGDKIILRDFVDGASDWRMGEIDGKLGIFPSAFVEEM